MTRDKSTSQQKSSDQSPLQHVDVSADDAAYIRPSERMFRRSRSSRLRRKQAEKRDEKFIRTVFGIAGFSVLLIAVFFFAFYQPQ